jgi:hypothetical protein
MRASARMTASTVRVCIITIIIIIIIIVNVIVAVLAASRIESARARPPQPPSAPAQSTATRSTHTHSHTRDHAEKHKTLSGVITNTTSARAPPCSASPSALCLCGVRLLAVHSAARCLPSSWETDKAMIEGVDGDAFVVSYRRLSFLLRLCFSGSRFRMRALPHCRLGDARCTMQPGSRRVVLWGRQ